VHTTRTPWDEKLLCLLAATQDCPDNPGTLGVDISANEFFAVKTIGDMKILLSHLASNNSTDRFDSPTAHSSDGADLSVRVFLTNFAMV
jgi:hypothetical protein